MKSSWKKQHHPPLRPAILTLVVLAIAGMFAAAARADRPYAPSRDYHLENVRVSLRFDLDQRKVIGEVTHTLSSLRDGLISLHEWLAGRFDDSSKREAFA